MYVGDEEMKHGKRPTRKQKQVIEAAGWNIHNWLVSKAETKQLLIVHRYSGKTREIPL